MYFETIGDASSCPAYLIADEQSRLAALVNPQPSLSRFREVAKEHGFRIRYIFLSEIDDECDYWTFALETGAKLYTFDPETAERESMSLVKSGDVLEFGKVRLSVFPPACSDACVALHVFDLEESDRVPHVVLGDPTHSNESTN